MLQEVFRLQDVFVARIQQKASATASSQPCACLAQDLYQPAGQHLDTKTALCIHNIAFQVWLNILLMAESCS
jgi:hypothetical protein